MKKAVLFFALIILAGQALIGQVKLGAVAGGVLAKSTYTGNTGNRFGLYAGLTGDITLTKTLSFRPQLKYVKKGEKTQDENQGDYHYLELPANVVYNIPTAIGRFSLGAGPAFSYMINGSWSYSDGEKEKIYFDFDKVNRLDIGANAIFGYEIKNGIFFNANYTLGLRDVWTADFLGSNKNQAFSFGAGIMF